MCLMSNGYDIFKIHGMTTFVDLTRKFGVVVEHRLFKTAFLCSETRVLSDLSVWP